MTELRRRTVLAMTGSLVMAGCVTDPGTGTPPGDPSTDRSPADAREPADGITPGGDQFQPDHPVYLSNTGTRDHVVAIEVVRQATGETVFAEPQPIRVGNEREVYNLARADPDGIESFSICGSLVDPTPSPSSATTGTLGDSTADCVTMRTDACYGSAVVTVDDGEIGVIYSIC